MGTAVGALRLSFEAEVAPEMVAMSDVRVLQRQRAQVILVALQADSARQVHVGHRLTSQRETAAFRFRRKRQQCWWVSGYRELLTAKRDDQEVVRVRLGGDRLRCATNDPGAVRALDQIELALRNSAGFA